MSATAVRETVGTLDGLTQFTSSWVSERQGAGHEWANPVASQVLNSMTVRMTCSRCHASVVARAEVGGKPRINAAGSPSYVKDCSGDAPAGNLIDGVPFQDREVLIMGKRREGLSWEKIGADLGISRERVRTIHARAIARRQEAQ